MTEPHKAANQGEPHKAAYDLARARRLRTIDAEVRDLLAGDPDHAERLRRWLFRCKRCGEGFYELLQLYTHETRAHNRPRIGDRRRAKATTRPESEAAPTRRTARQKD